MGWNVLAAAGPADAPVLVIGAHYDAVPGSPGADDNASGVAVLLELARLLANRKDLPFQVRFAAYAPEEQPWFDTPMRGSRVHAAERDIASPPLLGALILDGVGFFSSTPGSQRSPFAFLEDRMGDTGDFLALVGTDRERELLCALARACDDTGIPCRVFDEATLLPVVLRSDHLSYWERNIPAVLVTDTAGFRNPNIHRETDVPQTLDYPRMARLVDAIRLFLSRYGETYPCDS